MVVQTPGAEMRAKIGCKGVGIVINGVDFLADFIILRSQGLDVILGMDWLIKHQDSIRLLIDGSCSRHELDDELNVSVWRHSW